VEPERRAIGVDAATVERDGALGLADRAAARAPIDRLAEERALMRALPGTEPDVDRRWVTRVPPDPHVRFDTNDYSRDPTLVGRRVEVRASQREIVAVALDSGQLAARYQRCSPRTARSTRRTLRQRRREPDSDLVVEQRPLTVYDGLIA
jgi:hypothetical protein